MAQGQLTSDIQKRLPSDIDVGAVIDNLPIGRFHVILLIACALLALSDGYDIAVIGFAGPSLVREWKIANLAALAPVFSAGLFGVLFGAPLFGYFGDRFGRKAALILSALLYGLFSLLTSATSSLDQMVVMRFLTGLALGGVLPTTIALAAEYAPRSLKVTFGLIVNIGIVIGAGLPGPVAAWLVPDHGWPILFLIGGIMPIVLAAAVWPVLPESIKFLSLRPKRRADLAAIVSKLRPDIPINASTNFIAPEEARKAGRSLKYLFAGNLAIVTPLLWICFLVSQMSSFFFQTWLPTLMASAGLPPTQAALSYTWFQTGGVISAIVISRPMDKYGFGTVAFLFLASIPAIASFGYAFGSGQLQGILSLMAAGFCLDALLISLLSGAGALYPTPIRSSGIGWTFALGRAGGVLGPIVGAVLVSLHLTTQQLFLAAAAPLVVGLVASAALARIYSMQNKTLEIKEAIATH
jgi:MFS transporter, AAHS family, 4-hydroxybenzoate transporter